jgi:hypothetical protein
MPFDFGDDNIVKSININQVLTNFLEVYSSDSDAIAGYNKVRIYCKAPMDMSIEIYTGDVDFTTIDTYTGAGATNNTTDFQTAGSIQIAAGEHFDYQFPVSTQYYFVRITKEINNNTPYLVSVNTYKMNADITPIGLRDSNIKLNSYTQHVRPISDFRLDMKDSNLEGFSPFKLHAIGNYTSDAKLLTLSGNATASNLPQYNSSDIVTPTTVARNFVVAAGANDTASGTGARTILITGVDQFGDIKSFIQNLGGNVGQQTPATLAHINSVVVLTTGSVLLNDGDIVGVEETGGQSLFSFIMPSGAGVAKQPYQSIPAKTTTYLDNISIRYDCVEPASIVIRKANYKTTTSHVKSDPVLEILYMERVGGNGSIDIKTDVILQERDVIYVEAFGHLAQGSGAGGAYASSNLINVEITGINKITNFSIISNS